MRSQPIVITNAPLVSPSAENTSSTLPQLVKWMGATPQLSTTTSVLKAWWQTHAKWPYPTEEDKARLVQETGLQLKQINNWFINQRKRNWHSNPSTSRVSKSKRKR